MNLPNNRKLWTGVAFAAVTVALGGAYAQQGPRGRSSYAPVEITEPFSAILARLSAQKPAVEREHMAVLNERYDLSNRPAAGVTMDHAKPVQEGDRIKLPAGATWDGLAGMTPEQIRNRNLFPLGFLPLPHPKHQEGGMVFPRFEINEIKRQEGRDLTRFDVDFDIPDHLLPEFPPAIYLNQRLDLGDVSQGQLVTVENYYQLFNGIINPKQLEGLRLLVTPFPQQQFNQTEDRRSEQPSRGVTCFDCHSNGHTNRATHLARDARPTETRIRITTPTLRGVFIQRLFGSQRALKTVEDFTEFEQRGAYFDGDDVIAFSNAAIRSTSWPSSRRCWDSRRRRSSTCWESSIRARPPPPSCAGRRSSSARANAVPATPRPTTRTTSCTISSSSAFSRRR